MIIVVPECPFCEKSDKVKTKTIWFKHKKKPHYITVWICDRCNFVVGEFWSA